MDFLQNIKPRRYQEEIAKTCLKKNCLVVLPTGLGKTLIALMISIERQKEFPREKILFLAPTKPLAEQHIKSFKKNLPEMFADMQLFTGTVVAKKRKKIWQTADIIFSTPQCIANDLKKKLYSLEDVSLLIEDEAHRCVKNYDYNFIAKKYMEQSKNPRLIGLTASPGSDQLKIREICKNLSIEAVELRSRESPDVKEYLQELEFEKLIVELPEEIKEISKIIRELYEEYLSKLKNSGVLIGQINKISLLEAQKKISAKLSSGNSSPYLYTVISEIAQAIKLSHAIELIETQTLDSFNKYLKNLYNQASKKQSKGVVKLVSKEKFTQAYNKTNELISKGKEHPKIDKLIEIIENEKENSKIIIFTQFRETASLISEKINKINSIKSKVFVGQAKKQGVGLSQKRQKEIIEEFSDGKTNVLCATCIAEEGLDIPEVSKVIFYEPVSSAIRSIQRRGRTARLQKGNLTILITKGTKDEFAYYASRAREKKMEKSIHQIKKQLNQKKLF